MASHGMKALIGTLVLSLFLVCTGSVGWAQTLARMNVTTVGGGTPAAGTTYPDIIFWLNAEANDTSSPYSMGSSECGADTDIAMNSSMTVTNTNPKVGTYCFSPSSPDGNDYLSVDVTDGNLFPTKGRVGFWHRTTTWPGLGELIFAAFLDANNWFILRGTASEEVFIQWKISGSKEIDDVPSTTANISVGATAWHFYEIAWDTTLGATDYVDVYIDGTRYIHSVQALTALSPSALRFADYEGISGSVMALDNIIISNDPTRDLYESGTGLSVATSKPSGSCP